MKGIAELKKNKEEILEQIRTLTCERNETLKQLNDIYTKGKSDISAIKLSNNCYELIIKISALRTQVVNLDDTIKRIERGY